MSDQWRGPLAVLWRGLNDDVWLGHSHVAGDLIDAFQAGRIRELKRWAVAQVGVFLNDEAAHAARWEREDEHTWVLYDGR